MISFDGRSGTNTGAVPRENKLASLEGSCKKMSIVRCAQKVPPQPLMQTNADTPLDHAPSGFSVFVKPYMIECARPSLGRIIYETIRRCSCST